MVVVTARHIFEMYSKTHIIKSMHYTRSVNSNGISSNTLTNQKAATLKRDEVFEVEKLKTPLIVKHDYYPGVSIAEAKEKYPPWEYTNDCAFLKVRINGLDWVT